MPIKSGRIKNDIPEFAGWPTLGSDLRAGIPPHSWRAVTQGDRSLCLRSNLSYALRSQMKSGYSFRKRVPYLRERIDSTGGILWIDGNAKPSAADLQITKCTASAAQILQIHFLDHVIVYGRRTGFLRCYCGISLQQRAQPRKTKASNAQKPLARRGK